METNSKNLLKLPLKIDRKTGLLNHITYHPAGVDNFSLRPDQNDISLLVIHDTEIVAPSKQDYDQSIVHYMFTGQYEKLEQIYPNDYARIFPDGVRHVSAHLVIRRSGEIIQYVPFNKMAHHAGISEFYNRNNCNDFSIGIELEGFANRADFLYTDEQYTALANVTKTIMQVYPLITMDRIAGHEEIARPEGRKSDPGETFDWEQYKKLIKV